MNKINMIFAGEAISKMFNKVSSGFCKEDEKERLLAVGMKFVAEYNSLAQNDADRLVGTIDSYEDGAK